MILSGHNGLKQGLNKVNLLGFLIIQQLLWRSHVNNTFLRLEHIFGRLRPLISKEFLLHTHHEKFTVIFPWIWQSAQAEKGGCMLEGFLYLKTWNTAILQTIHPQQSTLCA